jgi:hypothetical protein
MHLLSTGVANKHRSCLPCADLMTCSSLVEFTVEKAKLLCASSLIDSQPAIAVVTAPSDMCVVARTCRSSSCTLNVPTDFRSRMKTI